MWWLVSTLHRLLLLSWISLGSPLLWLRLISLFFFLFVYACMCLWVCAYMWMRKTFMLMYFHKAIFVCTYRKVYQNSFFINEIQYDFVRWEAWFLSVLFSLVMKQSFVIVQIHRSPCSFKKSHKSNITTRDNLQCYHFYDIRCGFKLVFSSRYCCIWVFLVFNNGHRSHFH